MINRYSIVYILMLALVIVAEISLVEYKYYIFSGGMNQTAPLESIPQILSFLVTYLFSFFAVFLIYVLSVNVIKLRFRLTEHKITLDTVFWFCLIYGVTLALKFKLHSYFSDAMDANLMANIAGGSLINAVRYASSEVLVAVVPIILAILGYYAVKRLLTQQRTYSHLTIHALHLFKASVAWALLAAMIIVPIFLAHSDEPTARAAKKTQSFRWVNDTASNLLDIDRDGSSPISVPSDPDNFDGSIFYGAVDLPLNGIDENGLNGDFNPNETQSAPFAFSWQGKPPKHIFLLVIESARGDAFGKTIGGETALPTITHLGQTGMATRAYYSHVGFTAASLHALFTGGYAPAPSEASLFQVAHQNAWVSAVISGQDETWGGLDINTGHRALAEYFYDPQEDPEKRVFPSKLPSSIKLSGAALADAFETYTDQTNWEQKHFIYMNFQAAHFPYYHSQMPLKFIDKDIPRAKIKKEEAQWVQNTYWNALHYSDQQIKRVLQRLKQKNILDESLVIIIGDHGEELFEDQYLGHGHALNDRQLNTLFVSSTNQLKVNRPIGHVDLHALLTQLISGQKPINYKARACVFHHIGALDKPTIIGETCPDQTRRIYNFRENIFRIEHRLSGQTVTKIVQGDKRLKQLFNTYESVLFHNQK